MEFMAESYMDKNCNTEIPLYLRQIYNLDENHVVQWTEIGEEEYKITFKKKM